ncbi:DUF7523 family protein [Halorubrum laminariae]|uniref:ACT domain-containing protein n=1 Tax=Halorubrum laminariae TaxID=1433523 RepID=A0ABD6BY53_9EURY|nr:hypothetical protein [Halorubrum laminariae]
MSLAAAAREAVRARPFLRDALRAGVVNHSAAAAWLAADADLDGDVDAIATALRRFREELPDYETAERTASVSMRSGVCVVHDRNGGDRDDGDRDGDDSPAHVLLRVGDAVLADGGSETAILATGEVDAAALATTLRRLAAADVAVSAAAVVGESLVIAVERRDGPTAVRVVEAALAAVPDDA